VSSQLEKDLVRAEEEGAEAELLFRRLESSMGLAHSLEGRALICLRERDTARAALYLSEALALLQGPEQAGCLAHVLEAAATLCAHIDLRTEAVDLLDTAEQLRRDAGQAHRPWELRSRGIAAEILATHDIVPSGSERGGLDVASAAAHAIDLLGSVDARS